MRRAAASGLCVLALLTGVVAADLLDASRAAVTGGRSLAPLRSLKMSGRLRVAAGRDATVDGTVEIRLALPQRYLRLDTMASTRRVSGFDGDRVLTAGSDRSADRLRRERGHLTRLMLGAAALVVSDERVEMQPGGEEAFPDTRTLDLTAKSWSLRYVMDATTAMPMRLVYFGTGRGTTITSFADRRDVDGYQLPYRVTTTTSELVLETLMFDEIVVNPPLTAADFRP